MQKPTYPVLGKSFYAIVFLGLMVIAIWFIVQSDNSLITTMIQKTSILHGEHGSKNQSGITRSETTDGLGKDASRLSGIPPCKDAVPEKEEESYENPVNPLKLVSGFGTDIVLFSAVVGNTSANYTWDKIATSAWEAIHLENQTYICCVKLTSGKIKSYPLKKLIRGGRLPMASVLFVCHMNDTDLNDMPVAMNMADATKGVCHKYTAQYIDVEYAYRHPGEVAIFGKVFYGNLSAYDLLTWIAIHRLQGVDQFLIYPYQMTPSAIKVLRYYERQGFVKVVPYSRPGDGPFESLGLYQTYNDQIITEYDGLERLRGYDYMVNFDMDEYILTRTGETWWELFDRKFNASDKLGSFWFQSYIFIKNWGATDAESPFTVAKYTYRTNATADTSKLVIDPSRVIETGLSTHFSIFEEGCTGDRMGEEDAAIHHFRSCRAHWLEPNADFPCMNITRNHDEHVLKLFKQIENELMNIVKELGI